MKWIHINDELPKAGEYVLCANIIDGKIWNWDKCRYSLLADCWIKENKNAGEFNYWISIEKVIDENI